MTAKSFAVAAAFLACAASAAAQTTSTDVVFSEYSPFSANTELARRMLTPLDAARLPQLLVLAGKALAQQPVDLSKEKFFVYVPTQKPAAGYGLIVFVPPWDGAGLPEGWAAVLDADGFIFVTAAQSGNDQSPLGRREPLALLAEQNVATRYPLDPTHIFIAGLSGGSRIAMRLALAYPDIFRGAILNAGSDPTGNPTAPIPARDLFVRFQSQSRLVYVTGEKDLFHLGQDAVSMQSMRDWCMFNVEKQIMPDAGHEVASPAALSRALDALLAPIVPDEGLASCRAGIDAELDKALQQVRALAAAGKTDDARKLLTDIDARYGGLAAPQSLELSDALAKAQ